MNRLFYSEREGVMALLLQLGLRDGERKEANGRQKSLPAGRSYEA